MAKRVITTALDVNNERITFTAEGAEPIVFHADRASAENRKYAEFHGWKQKLSDAAALEKDASVEDRMGNIRELAEYFEGGEVEWNRRGTGPRPFNVALLIEALAAVKFHGDVEKAKVQLGKVAAHREVDEVGAAKLFFADALIAAKMVEIQRKRTPTKLSADDLLSELGDDAPTEPSEEELQTEVAAELGELDITQPKQNKGKGRR